MLQPDDSFPSARRLPREDGERERLEESWISVHPSDFLGLLPVVLDQLAQRVDAVYLHIDLDVVESKENSGVNYRGPGGLPLPDAKAMIRLVAASVKLAAVAFTNYNVDLDMDAKTERVAMELLRALDEPVQ